MAGQLGIAPLAQALEYPVPKTTFCIGKKDPNKGNDTCRALSDSVCFLLCLTREDEITKEYPDIPLLVAIPNTSENALPELLLEKD